MVGQSILVVDDEPGIVEIAIRGLEAGAVQYMAKPFYPLDLIAAVKINLEVFDAQLRQDHRRLLVEKRRRLLGSRSPS